MPKNAKFGRWQKLAKYFLPRGRYFLTNSQINWKLLTIKAKKPKDLLKIKDLRVGLLTASGLSEKALNYLTENDRTLAITGLIEKFLEPAGENFTDELIYRYLITKGDALGGKARNLAGTLGERKFLRHYYLFLVSQVPNIYGRIQKLLPGLRNLMTMQVLKNELPAFPGRRITKTDYCY